MPTFTFEKISSIARPPISDAAMAVMTPPGGAVKPRSVIVHLIDRLAEKRARRDAARDANRRDIGFTEYDIKPRR